MLPNGSRNALTPGVHTWKLSYGAIGTVLLGFLMRVYLFAFNPTISPDGFLYIQQAKALYFGLFDQVLACYMYLAPYPILVALVYPVLGDWVVGAQWVNIFFSTLTIIPFYWLLRRFFGDMTAWITLMVFALLPEYVSLSRDVLRDPTFWFFSVSGLYLFILHMEKRSFKWLLLSSVCLTIGAWARIEATLFIIVSIVFLLFLNKTYRWKDMFFFLVPYIAIAATSIILAHFRAIDLIELLKPQRLLSLPLGVISNYDALREQLYKLYNTELITVSPYFIPQVRKILWFIPLGTLLAQLAETLLFLFFILLFVGMVFWTKRLKTDRRVLYLWILSIMSLALLYVQIIYYWHFNSRFLAVFLFPSFIFIGTGIKRLTTFFSSRFQLRNNLEYAIMIAIILALLLPKTLRANFSEDKLVFNEIGNYIAERENNSRPVSVCGAFKDVRVINFYANVNSPGAPCLKNTAIFKNTDAKELKQVLIQDFDYFIWDQQGWKNKEIEKLSLDIEKHFIKLQEWPSNRWGKLILYEVVR